MHRLLRKSARLKSSRGFAAVFSKGRSFATDLLVIHVLARGCGGARFGFSVSAKVGRAVARNRVKRLLREAVRTRLPEIGTGCDVVIVARKKCAEAPWAQISDSVARLLRKAGLTATEEESRERQSSS